MNICFFTKHEINWGSSRERIGAYLDYIRKRSHTYKIVYCIPNKLSRAWISGNSRIRLFNVIYSFWRSRILKHLKLIWIIFMAKKFDKIVIQKVNLFYPLVRILRLRNRNIVFDFDDLCFWNLESAQKKKLSFAKRLSFWRKGIQHPEVLRLYSHIIVGNRYLANIATAMKSEKNVTIIPTPINCDLYKPQNGQKRNSPIIIGWSGTGENHLRHLELLVNPLKTLEKNFTFIFKLVGAMHSKRIKGSFDFLGPKFHCIEWVEPQLLPAVIRTFDIGVMPLRDDDEARAKCGFKALAYMASGVATVVSPVGVNEEIIEDGINGFLAKDQKEWIEKISLLIADENLRDKFAKEGRKTVREFYSLDRISNSFLDIIERS